MLKVYLDSANLETVGCGHLLTADDKRTLKLGQKITSEQSDAFLTKDLASAGNTVKTLVKVPINDNQRSALTSLIFNIGAHAFSGSSVLRKLNQKDYVSASNHFLDWVKATVKGKLVVVKGLTRRREAERKLFLTPDTNSLSTPTPTQARANSVNNSANGEVENGGEQSNADTVENKAAHAPSPLNSSYTEALEKLDD